MRKASDTKPVWNTKLSCLELTEIRSLLCRNFYKCLEIETERNPQRERNPQKTICKSAIIRFWVRITHS